MQVEKTLKDPRNPNANKGENEDVQIAELATVLYKEVESLGGNRKINPKIVREPDDTGFAAIQKAVFTNALLEQKSDV